MSDSVRVEFELIEAMPELRLIHLLMEASKRFDNELTLEEKARAIRYFNDWVQENMRIKNWGVEAHD